MSVSTNTAVIGQIRAVMARKGVTQAQLGERCFRRQQWIGRRLTGAVPLTLDDVDAIAAALDVDPHALTCPPQNGA